MAIQETILGPNSSMFTVGAADTPAQILAAFNTYITAHGWELFDATAPTIAPSGTGAVGNVWRTLQAGSATMYKYVGIGISSAGIQFKIYESWNAATHAGLNDGTYVSNGSSAALLSHFTNVVGIEGTALYLFVNPRWLAFRAKSTTNIYSNMCGAFEISKDTGEAESIPSNIFMITGLAAAAIPSSQLFGLYGSTRSTSGSTGVSATQYNNISTQFGVPFYVTGGYQFNLTNMMPSTVPNTACTITAVEMANLNGPQISKIRGRIFGLKMLYGNSAWNDMDTASLTCDANFFTSSTGSVVNHHAFIVGAANTYYRFMLPA